MTQWRVFNPDHEFLGQVLIDLANAVGSDEILPYYQKHGLTDISAKAWYPQQKLVDIYNDLECSKSGSMFDLVSIGITEAEQAVVPPIFESLPLLTILQKSMEVLKLNNRGTDPGDIQCEAITDKHVRLTLRVTTPDNLWYGIVYGFVRRFIPKGTHFKVYFDKDIARREFGGDVTIIHVVWD